MSGRVTVALGALVCAGCAPAHRGVADAFPPGSSALPWALQGSVWSGTLDQAASGLGADADRWRAVKPTGVWLAIYQHADRPEVRLTARIFAFADRAAAQSAFQQPAAPDQPTFRAGDEGRWTAGGVAFRWGRLIVEVFGGDDSPRSQFQAAYLVGFLEKNMPPGVPDEPR